VQFAGSTTVRRGAATIFPSGSFGLAIVSIAAASLERYVARCAVRTSHKTGFVACDAVKRSQGAPSCRQNRKLIDAHDVDLFCITDFAIIEIEKGNL
jgi:hypothetical protein